MTFLPRWLCVAATAFGLLTTGGCTTTSLLLSVAGVATDTSVTWDIIKHVHATMTEGDDRPCALLDSVERALSPRCGEFISGSLRPRDIATSPFGACALATAAADTRLWPALPELLARGARSESCAQPAIIALAQANECPDLARSTPQVRAALADLARRDPRAVHHDTVRWLSCPASRVAGFDGVLTDWLASGALNPDGLAFSPLAALHPSAFGTPLPAAFEAHGQTAAAALGGYVGQRPPGFETALRQSDWVALEWWLARVPQLANRVPGNQLDWLPLVRVIAPGFLAHPESRADMVGFLLARGADPRTRLPSDTSQSVIAAARSLRSPLVPVLVAALEATPAVAETPVKTVATNDHAIRLIGP